MTTTPEDPDAPHAIVPAVSFREALGAWCRIAALSFGGPAGQIAVMHRILVEEKRWLAEDRFLHALNYCMLLPGPEAQQLATYTGWLLHGTLGGLAAGTLFVLPGFLSILALSVLHVTCGSTAAVAGLFFGLKPAVLALVVDAVLRIGRRALKRRWLAGVSAAAFVLTLLRVAPFPGLVFGAGLLGLIVSRFRPDLFPAADLHGTTKSSNAAGPKASAPATAPHGVAESREVPLSPAARRTPGLRRAAVVLATGLALWFGPLWIAARVLGPDHVLVQEGVFFSEAAVVTFGGAYAVLSYVADEAVLHYGWLQPSEMLDGLGMAETTPGPLIQVVQFVGFVGAYRRPEPFGPLEAGWWGSVTTTWVTFVPCFLWIFLGAPYVERMRGHRAAAAALTTITAAVLGAMLHLAFWFAAHVLLVLAPDRTGTGAGRSLPRPEQIEGVHWIAVALAVGAGLAIVRWKIGVPKVLAACAAIGIAWRLLGGT